MVAKLDILARGIGAAPRRSVFHALAGAGLGTVIGAEKLHPPTAARRKKKGKGKNACTCPPAPRCPASCSFIYNEVSGKTICASGGSVSASCPLCSASKPCTDVDFPHCVKDFIIVSSGQTMRIDSCEPYTEGVCAAVYACVT